MLIYLLRHGDASSSSRFHDNENPLSDRGKHQAVLAGKFLQKMNSQVDIILSSPLKRAQQTAEITNSFISSQKNSVSEYLVNGADQHQLLRHLNDLNVSSTLLVGHIPHLSDTISLLVYGNYENNIEMKKCSLAVVEIAKPILPGTGKLKQLTHIETIAKFIKS